MSADTEIVICPDCGGVVGATEASAQGLPCKCFDTAPKKEKVVIPKSILIAEEKLRGNEEDVAEPSPVEAAPGEKVCHQCGKVVSGHRRLKDSRGYICLDCAKKEHKEKKPQGVKCPKCFRVVKPETIATFKEERMCQRCLREAQDMARPGSKRFRKIDDKHFEQQSKTQLYVLIGVALVLGIIIVVSLLK